METIVLLPGFGLGPFIGKVAMLGMEGGLGKHGIICHHCGYPVSPEADDLGARFLELVNKVKPVAIVGHSFGGVIAVSQMVNLPSSVKHIVCIGSPLRGSAIARSELARGGSRIISPAAEKLLISGVVIPKSNIAVGVIAGTSGYIGMNLLYRVLEGEHDGTVSVEETKIPGIADHMTVDSGHTALPWNSTVAAQVSIFLRLGHFVVERRPKPGKR